MAAHKIRIDTVCGHGPIEVDGHPVKGVRGITYTQKPLEPGILTLDVIVHEGEINGVAFVVVPDKTKDTLITLGWTPPLEP